MWAPVSVACRKTGRPTKPSAPTVAISTGGRVRRTPRRARSRPTAGRRPSRSARPGGRRCRAPGAATARAAARSRPARRRAAPSGSGCALAARYPRERPTRGRRQRADGETPTSRRGRRTAPRRPGTVTSATSASAIRAGSSTRSTQPVASAFHGIDRCSAVSGSWTITRPPRRLDRLHARASRPTGGRSAPPRARARRTTSAAEANSSSACSFDRLTAPTHQPALGGDAEVRRRPARRSGCPAASSMPSTPPRTSSARPAREQVDDRGAGVGRAVLGIDDGRGEVGRKPLHDRAAGRRPPCDAAISTTSKPMASGYPGVQIPTAFTARPQRA